MLSRFIKKLKQFQYKRAIASDSIAERFENIYNRNIWSSNGYSRSGSGSTLEATRNVREQLPKILRELNASNLYDVGCGDFFWMKEVDLPCSYIGLDLVHGIIEENREKYVGKGRSFLCHDAVEEPLPAEADVVLCREVLFHLSFEHGKRLIRNVLDSNVRYLLFTTTEQIDNNMDIRTGEFRNVNLNCSPYNFPPYFNKIEDSVSVSQNRFLALWDANAVRSGIDY